MQKFTMGEISSSRRKGFYISRCSAITCILLTLLIVAVAFLAAYLYVMKKNSPGSSNNTFQRQSTGEIDFKGNVYPIHYRLQLFPFLNSTLSSNKRNFTLHGQAKIFFKIYQKINTIEFHASGLNIEHATVTLHALGHKHIGPIMSTSSRWTKDFSRNESKSFKNFRIKGVDCDEISEVCSLKVAQYVSRGSGILMLTINYWTQILQAQSGVFYDNYHDLYNQKKSWYIATHLNPSYARKAFPCFDQPIYNATFDISILRHYSMRSLSSSEVASEEILKDGEWVWDHFKRTRSIAPMNVAFIVLDAAEVKVLNGTPPFSIWSIPSEATQTNFVAHIIPKMLKIMENVTSVPCPMTYLNIVILPGLPLSAGGWSLIFLDATDVLPYRRNRADLFEFRASKTLAGPIVHQWFLAFSNPSWTKMWMDQSLQLYLSKTLLKNLNSGWKVWSHFQATMKPALMHSDALKFFSAITNGSSQGISLYSQNEYQVKGALLFLMFLGPDGSIKFKSDTIFTSYLSCTVARNNANCQPWKLNFPSNILNSTDLTLSQALFPWVKKYGFPLITVTPRISNGPIYTEQDSTFSSNDSLWYIPIDYMTQDSEGPKKHFLYPRKEMSMIYPQKNSSSWIVLNSLGRGYYRVNYSDWSLLQEQLMFGNLSDIIPDVGKAQLLDDAFSLASFGVIPYSVPLNLTSYLSLSEVDFPPWSVALYHLNYMEMFLWDTPAYAYYRIYMLNLLNPIYEALKLDVIDFHLISELRNLIVNKMCLLGLPQCNDWAKVVFETFMNQVNVPSLSRNSSKFPDSMKYIVYCAAVNTGGKDSFYKLRELYFNTNTSRKSQSLIAKCLTCTSNEELVHRILDDTIDQDEFGYVMTEVDALNVWKHFSLKPQAAGVVFEHLRINWSKIYKRFYDNVGALQELVFSVASSLTRPIHVTDFNLLQNHWKNLKNVNKLFAASAERVSTNCDWRKNYLPGMTDLFYEMAKTAGKMRSR